ncbi:unnamed protein product [Bemisia tabaci]|uniref:Uncharacterized protein n=1 Tax=Bemisia tabaci TaxID=7038 RepID=A0A9P0AQ69_BEMTA|nr:unnamed protein product [Bemisia tabaci]
MSFQVDSVELVHDGKSSDQDSPHIDSIEFSGLSSMDGSPELEKAPANSGELAMLKPLNQKAVVVKDAKLVEHIESLGKGTPCPRIRKIESPNRKVMPVSFSAKTTKSPKENVPPSTTQFSARNIDTSNQVNPPKNTALTDSTNSPSRGVLTNSPNQKALLGKFFGSPDIRTAPNHIVSDVVESTVKTQYPKGEPIANAVEFSIKLSEVLNNIMNSPTKDGDDFIILDDLDDLGESPGMKIRTIKISQNSAPSTDSMDVAPLDVTASSLKETTPVNVVEPAENIISSNDPTDVTPSDITASSTKRTTPVKVIEHAKNTTSSNQNSMDVASADISEPSIKEPTPIQVVNIQSLRQTSTENTTSSNDPMDVVEIDIIEPSTKETTPLEIVDLATPPRVVKSIRTPTSVSGAKKKTDKPLIGASASFKAKERVKPEKPPVPSWFRNVSFTEIGNITGGRRVVSVRGKIIFSSRPHRSGGKGLELYFDVADETGIIRVFAHDKVAFFFKKQIVVGKTLQMIRAVVHPRQPLVNNLDHPSELHLDEYTDLVWEVKSRLLKALDLDIRFVAYEDVESFGADEFFDVTGTALHFRLHTEEENTAQIIVSLESIS